MKHLFLILISLFAVSFSASAKDGDALKSLPVQDGGRIKPYDSFSREMLEIVYGKSKFEGRAATEIVLTWMLSPQAWHDKKIFEVRNHEVLTALNLPKEQRYFSGEELFAGDRFTLLRQELQSKRETKEKLNPYFQALQRLENQYFVFQEIASGRMLKVLPPKEGDTWLSIADLEPAFQEKFMNITKSFVINIGNVAKGESTEQSAKDLDKSVLDFQDAARAQNPALYNVDSRIKAEVHYNNFHPFRWAYIFYFLAFIGLLLVWTLRKESLMKGVWVLMALGFILHTYGFGLRMYIMERAPVSNMYETVVWVSWGTIVFAAILELIYKFRLILVAGTLVAAFGLVIADFAPAVLDPSLQPLEPVLRSNYWLTIHVMTITISYAAFFLAFGLGDIGLYYYLRGEQKHQEQIKGIVTGIYRAIQIGVAFLAPGIILGGIWADYSWGRFWGWDPKETWALIALLGYLAVLHARYAGMLKHFGMVVTSIVAFSLVIMAWYGVNFVLGAGLHSYGFGAGGVEYVSAFVAAHILLVIYVSVIRSGKRKLSS
ncbi:cytochrome c biogenesis protein [Bdellovibrio reynosensis]|uniref:Cytochrome c biogenesis protein CcsA n=1 Tax=Bdellovibrio reynosensis TaxID=2835041 RepID=A0ABY4CJA5_9BACT|nr:cytochrome c biogenesis protein CcsA [Bdellovibrio reynosensis]UOF02320.1 cytochrome c biogenesis protein CcsA [Bdellovibrio reynosensis]